MKTPYVLIILILQTSFIFASPRPAAVSGQFYPSSQKELSEMVQGFLSNVPESNFNASIKAILVPHAGYIYSGQTAAYAYKLLKNRNIKIVIIIGNSHHFYLKKGSVYSSGSFETPLGEVNIDSTLAKIIIQNSKLLQSDTDAHQPEHSIEVQLPFLQSTLKDFKIVPILLSPMPLENTNEIAKAIVSAIKELKIEGTTLIIASSDMSHYPSWADARLSDPKAIEALQQFDPELLKSDILSIMRNNIPNLSCVFCGEESIYTTMYAAKLLGADSVKTLIYTNSGESFGDKSRVVGYSSSIFYTRSNLPKMIKQPVRKKETRMENFSVSRENQQTLLKTARYSIEYTLENNKLPETSTEDPELKKPAAVFVTLTEGGALRGCIGTTTPQASLIEAVNQMAASAAFEDYRFNHVSKKELSNIKIEVSVLSPMTKVRSADEIKQNMHGVVVKRGSRSGIFLPQVWEHFSTKEDFLNELCTQKAGLEAGAWKDPKTELYVFTVFAFEEK